MTMNENVKPLYLTGKAPRYSDDEVNLTLPASKLIEAHIYRTEFVLTKFEDDEQFTVLGIKNYERYDDIGWHDEVKIQIINNGITIQDIIPYTAEKLVERLFALGPEHFGEEATEMMGPGDDEDDYEPIGTGIFAHWGKSDEANDIAGTASEILMEHGRLSLRNIRKLSQLGIKVSEGEMDSFGPLSMILTWKKDGVTYGVLSI